MKPPKFDKLPLTVQNTLIKKTQIDKYIYDELRRRWYELVAIENTKGFQQELAAFRSVCDLFQKTCNAEPSHPVCRWYSLIDGKVFKLSHKSVAFPIHF